MWKKFFEVDERGVFTELSRFACGIAPCGGEAVYAHSKEEAVNLYYRYRNGETSQLISTRKLPYLCAHRNCAFVHFAQISL